MLLLLLLSRFSRVQLLATPGLQPTRLLHPWDFPGKSTGVGCYCLLQRTYHACQLIKPHSCCPWRWDLLLWRGRDNWWRSLGIGDLQDFPVLMRRTPLLRWEIVLSLIPGISESELGRVALASHYQFEIISLPPSFTNLRSSLTFFLILKICNHTQS